jgi:glycosyltransferase involved in cell wall biosynthesis
MGVPAAWLARTPVILASQRNLAHVDWYTPFRRKLLRVIFRLSTAVIANSAAVRALLLEKFRVPADKVHVFHNGVDLDRFDDVERDRQKIDSRLSEETKLVVHIANMNSEVKGQAVLIEAARTVCTAIPLARFVLVGDGPLRGVYERRVKELELEDRVLFLGRRQDIAEILACGDLFAFPSFAEGMPNSVLEAGASGLPIVATPVGGIPEIVTHERTGLLVPPRDPEALAAAILRVLEDPGLASSLSRACQTWVRSQFSFDRLIRDLSGIYDGQKGTQ